MAEVSGEVVLLAALVALIGTFLSSFAQIAIAIDNRSRARSERLLDLEYGAVSGLVRKCLELRQRVFDPKHWPKTKEAQESLTKELEVLEFEVFPLVGFPKASMGLYDFSKNAGFVWQAYLSKGLDAKAAVSAQTIGHANRAHVALGALVLGAREILTESKMKTKKRLKREEFDLPPIS